jgi:hypothetical protein
MAVDQSIREALDLETLDLPPEPRVVRLHVLEIVDWEEVPALEISIVIPDETDVEAIPPGAMGEVTDAIHNRVLEMGETRLPYMRVLTETHFEERFGADSCTTT